MECLRLISLKLKRCRNAPKVTYHANELLKIARFGGYELRYISKLYHPLISLKHLIKFRHGRKGECRRGIQYNE